ncbi:hypothetical protein MYAM1_002537 [Malassezia yamatoensis]|uniref:HMG box domain-containing protein n=1 Tax=Malassezia yamatoensis TaxID=253288 RepID=A0AAJ6CGX3_9BASI|nr:hypothetical protein MYAM1_002537 [Malassezia yamatoensis]
MSTPTVSLSGHPMMNPNFQAHFAQSSFTGSNPMLCGADVGMHGGNVMQLPPLYPAQFVPNGMNSIIANTDALYLMNNATNPGYTAVEPSMVTALAQPGKVKKPLGRPRKYCVTEGDNTASVSYYPSEAPRKRGNHASQTPLRSRLKPPKQSPSAWQLFLSEELQNIKATSPDERLNVAHLAKDAGARYAELPEWKRQEYQARSQAAKEQHEKDLAEWRSKLTPEDIKQENAFRSAQRKLGKSRRSNLKDPNAPKKPLSAYFLYLRAIRKNPELCKEVLEGEHETTKQSVLAAAKWRSMSETEKQPYLIQAEKDKAEYERLRRDYEVHCGKGREGTTLPSEHPHEIPELSSKTMPIELALNKANYDQNVL